MAWPTVRLALPERPPETRPARLANASLAGAVLLWASYYPVMEALLESWDALVLSAVRLALSAALLAGLWLAREGRSALGVPLPWLRLWVLGGCGFAAFVLLTAVGIRHAGAAPAALVTAMNPALAVLLAWLVYAQHPCRRTQVAVALGIGGGVLVVLGGGGGGALHIWRGGEILVLLANIAWIGFSLAVQRRPPGLSLLGITALSASTGAVWAAAALGLALALGLTEPRFDLAPLSTGLVAYSALTSAGLAWVFWSHGVAHLGITVAALYGNLVPVLAVGLSLAFGGALAPAQWAGGALIVAGVAAAQWRGMGRDAGRPRAASMREGDPGAQAGYSSR